MPAVFSNVLPARHALHRALRGLWMGLLVMAGSGAWAQGAAAGAAGLLPAEVFFGRAHIEEAVLSPSGRLLAITSGRGGARVGLHVIELAGTGKPRAVAQFDDVDVHGVQWVNDEHLIFHVTDFSRGSGSGDGGWGLYSTRADGPSVRVLVQRKPRFVVDAGLGSRALSWNHRLLSVPAPRPGPEGEWVLVGRFTWDKDQLLDDIQPLWLNVRSGLTRPTEFAAPPNASAWIFDSQGEPRVVSTRQGAQRAVHWRGPGQREWQLLAKGGLLDMPFEPHAVDDAGQLYVLHTDRTEGVDVLARYDFARKAPSTQPLVSTPGFDFEGQLQLRPGRPALGVRLHLDAETTVWFDPQLQRLQALADQRFPGRVNQLICSACTPDDAVVLVRSYSDREPGQLWLYRAKPEAGQAAWQAVSRVRPDADPRRMASVDFQRIKARDGRDLPVWLTQPAGAVAGKPLPTVVLVHGGPWVRGGRWGWEPMAQFLASRGYLVIEPEFRGSTGYGFAHYRAGWKQWGQAMQDDVADALLWAQQQGLASRQACIAGASYGGYSSLMGLARHPELYRCGVAWVAVTDLALYASGSWWVSDDISGLGRRHLIPDLVGDPQKDAALLAAHSPVRLAHQIQAPLLLAYGDADLRVPLEHGLRLRDALKKAGREPEWVSYPGEGHGWARLQTELDFAQRVERFLAQHLSPAPR